MALGETIDTSNYVLGELYDKTQIATLGGVRIPGPRDWVGIVQFKGCVFLFVNLDKSDAAQDHKYHDIFEDSGSTLIWDSQKKNTQNTTFIQKIIARDLEVHLFVRIHKKIHGQTQPFCYSGRLQAEDYDGEKPVTLIFENLDFQTDPNESLKAIYDWRPDEHLSRRPVELKPSSKRKQRAATAKERRSAGQGRSANAEKNRATELRAMELAREHYESQGYVVIDTSANMPYDLECIRKRETRRVEVKGSSGGGDNVNVTIGEVLAARLPEPETDLFIVWGIDLVSEDGYWKASGGETRIIRNWYPDDEDLAPTQYQYSVPE